MPQFKAFEALTVSTNSVGFTVATFAANDSVFVTVEDAAVRFRLDGSAPTSTVGHLLEVGDVLELETMGELATARFIRRDGLDATLQSSFGT